MRSEYSKWFWSECDELNKDTSFAHSLAEKAWNYRQTEVDELIKQRDSFIKAYEIEMDESAELQKRVDDLTQVMEELLEEMKYPTATFEEVICSGVRELEQALKGGDQ